jgi:hypothetical protein
MMSPTRSVPSCTMTRATGPRPRSSRASITVPLARAWGSRLELEDLGLEQHAFEQLIDALPVFAETRHEHGLAAPLLGLRPEVREVALDLLGVGCRACRSC